MPRFPVRTRGFTLIELMIVVSVIAILLAIGIPTYSEQVRRSKRASVKSDMMEMVQRLERHHTTNNTYVGYPAAGVPSPSSAATPAYMITPTTLELNRFVLTAVPQGTQAQDFCGTLTIDSAGRKTESGPAPSVADCW